MAGKLSPPYRQFRLIGSQLALHFELSRPSMQLSDHSLRQIDEAYLERLGDGALHSLSSKLLLDLKEARERLNQISRNSSLPSNREA